MERGALWVLEGAGCPRCPCRSEHEGSTLVGRASALLCRTAECEPASPMSIYATLWSLKFPRYGDDYVGCEWIEVTAQGVPAHIGTPTPGFGYEDGDPYAEFLPPPVAVDPDSDAKFMRAVVIVTEEAEKSTDRSHQEYRNPLLVLSGQEYASLSFVELHDRICDALRGKGPRVVAQSWTRDGGVQLILSDGRILDSRKR